MSLYTKTAAAPVAALAALILSTPAIGDAPASRSEPMTVPLPAPIPDAKPVPYPGTIQLDIDASDIERGVYHVTETIPVAADAGSMTLLLPSWLPGNHGPRGPINLIADIHFMADGKPIGWTRDTVAVNAFHLDLPAGTKTVTARFLHTSPVQKDEGRITMTREMLNLQWEKMSLYPAGYYVRGITMKPTVTFPAGWQVFTALDGMQRPAGSNAVTWTATDYQRLVDSPVFAGLYASRWDLGHDVSLDAVADKQSLLAIAPDHLAAYKKLVSEAVALFGARHFDHYDFLLALTDRMGGIGLEHHRSSENQMEPKAFVDWDKMAWDRNVIPHEFTHSWNGKYRRPADLWTPDYQRPMQDTLLWVYEGQTQFWGYVLAARSGVQDKATVLGMWANAAARYSEGQPGRKWRSVEDTTNDPIINHRRPLPYSTLSRSEDYYVEGALVWLEADQIIRKGTNGKKGLDDFAKAFFGVRDGDWGELTYDFDTVVNTLNGVYPYDWASFLKTRLYENNQPAPMNGIEMAGYKLVWKDTPNPFDAGRAGQGKYLDLTYSIGARIGKDGTVADTLWDSPAFNAGLVPGARILAVGNTAYDEDTISDAVTAAKTSKEPIAFVIQRGDRVSTITVDYHGGLRFPWLVPASGSGNTPFDRLLAPRTK